VRKLAEPVRAWEQVLVPVRLAQETVQGQVQWQQEA